MTPEEISREIAADLDGDAQARVVQVAVPLITAAIRSAVAEAVAAEREACARIAETVPWELPEPSPIHTKGIGGRIAAAIRARKEGDE